MKLSIPSIVEEPDLEGDERELDEGEMTPSVKPALGIVEEN